jgi:hypothetical protein
VGCGLFFVVIYTLLGGPGSLGAIPATLLFAGYLFLTGYLCKKYENKKNAKPSGNRARNFSKTYLPSVTNIKKPFVFMSKGKWAVTGVSNNSKDDRKTDLSQVSRYDKLYFHLEITGGEPDKAIKIKYCIIFSDGSSSTVQRRTFKYSKNKQSFGLSCMYKESPQRNSGYCYICVFNDITNELLYCNSVYVSNM